MPKSGKKINRTEALIAFLKIVQAIGVVSVAMIAPNLVAGISKLRKPESAKRSVDRLTERAVVAGYLRMGSGKKTELTKKGERLLQLADTGRLRPRKGVRWDGKWRMIAFDIRESERGKRDRIREYLTNFGCRYLQGSIWIYPFPCERLVVLLKEEFNLKDSILYITADRFQGDGFALRHFDLERSDSF